MQGTHAISACGHGAVGHVQGRRPRGHVWPYVQVGHREEPGQQAGRGAHHGADEGGGRAVSKAFVMRESASGGGG
eukprot:scaffold143520_cov18-Tisochrysis_lutea.AAC.1